MTRQDGGMPARITSSSLTQGEMYAIDAMGATPVRAAILAVLTRHTVPLALADIAESVGVHRQTAYRHLQSLETLGVLGGVPEPELRRHGRGSAVLWELRPEARDRLAAASESIAAILRGAPAP